MTEAFVDDRPWLTLVAGPEGSGKNTLTRAIAASGFELGHYVNSDDIADEVLYRLDGEKQSQAMLDRAIANETAARRQYALDSGEAFTVETGLKTPGELNFIKLANAHDYRTRLIFVATENAALNTARVKRRQGGRDVPAKTIAADYTNALAQLAPACLLVDEAYLFDNSGAGLRLVASLVRGKDAKPGFRFAPPLPGWVMTFAQTVTALLSTK